MQRSFELVAPRFAPPLEASFRPAVLANRAYLESVESSGGGVPLVFGLERPDGSVSRFETRVFAEDHPQSETNLVYAERLFKFLLWQQGGWKAYVGGPGLIGDYIKACYAPGGTREFDFHFLGQDIYNRAFTVVSCDADQVPAERELGRPLGRHLDGYRIGFDLGASDRKVSAVIDGEVVYSQEVVWEPRTQSDPAYHHREIMAALKAAAAKLPRVDAVGGSVAGVYVDNRVRVASLFRGVPKERYDQVRNLFLRIRDELGVPLEIANDGDVSALAGSMALKDLSLIHI